MKERGPQKKTAKEKLLGLIHRNEKPQVIVAGNGKKIIYLPKSWYKIR